MSGAKSQVALQTAEFVRTYNGQAHEMLDAIRGGGNKCTGRVKLAAR